MALILLAGTRMDFATWFMLRPRSARASLSISPGWTGARRVLTLTAVFRDFDIISVTVLPSETNTVPIVDTNAMLTLAAAKKRRLQLMAGGKPEIAKHLR